MPRIYEVTEFTPVFSGYRLVPYGGMQPHFDATEKSTRLRAAPKAAAITPSNPARRVTVRFLGFAPSPEAYAESLRQAEEAVAASRRAARETEIWALVEIGLNREHASTVAGFAYFRRQAKRKYFWSLEEGPWYQPYRAILETGGGRGNAETGEKAIPLYRVSSWLRYWDYPGEVRAAVETWLMKNRER